jgi:hypothetical protein
MRENGIRRGKEQERIGKIRREEGTVKRGRWRGELYVVRQDEVYRSVQGRTWQGIRKERRATE